MIHMTPDDVMEAMAELERYSDNFPPPWALPANLRLISVMLAEIFALQRELEKERDKWLDEDEYEYVEPERIPVPNWKEAEIKKITDRVSKTTMPTGQTSWWYEPDGPLGYLLATGPDPEYRHPTTGRTSEDFGHFTREEDAVFVAHAREDVLWLLQELAIQKKRQGLTPDERKKMVEKETEDGKFLIEALARLTAMQALIGDPTTSHKHPATYYDLARQQLELQELADRDADDAYRYGFIEKYTKRVNKIKRRVERRAEKIVIRSERREADRIMELTT